MSDDESAYSDAEVEETEDHHGGYTSGGYTSGYDKSGGEDDERKKKGDDGANFLKNRQQMKMSELDEQLAEYIAEWRKQRQKEEDELNKLKDKQAKRKILRAEEEQKLTEQKKTEEDRKMREEAERKAQEQEAKRKRLEEVEKKRQAMMKPSDGVKKFAKSGDKLSNIQAAKGELGKTREQLAEEKKIAMGIRVQPLNLDGMQPSQLKAKAEQMWTMILKLETEKYDMEERMKRQDYDLKELKERQKMQLRHKAMKRGLEPEALTGKHPPKIQTASKFERRTDRRTYDDKKKLFEGGLEESELKEIDTKFKENMTMFENRTRARLPKWFGERPGRKAGEDTPEEGEEGDLEPPAPPAPEPEPEEEEEESSEEEEEEDEEEEEEEEEE